MPPWTCLSNRTGETEPMNPDMAAPRSLHFETLAELASPRLDQSAASEFELFTRSQYKQRVLHASINGRPAKASSTVRAGDRIAIEYLPEIEISMEGQDIPLDILFENDDVLVVNKDRGMVVHPGAGNPDGTLVNAFIFHCGGSPPSPSANGDAAPSPDDGAAFRPGIVHRLDKDTSGVIILAKSARALEELAAQFRTRETEKRYLALCDGHLSGEGVVRGFIRRGDVDRKRFIHDDSRGKIAETRWRVTGMADADSELWPRGLSALVLEPKTGRTHQLRVHCLHLGAPILGDPIYNTRFRNGSPKIGNGTVLINDIPLMLHALSLRIRLPGESDPRTFVAPIPPDMLNIASEAGIGDAFLSISGD